MSGSQPDIERKSDQKIIKSSMITASRNDFFVQKKSGCSDFFTRKSRE